MNSISLKTIAHPIDRELVLVANEVTKTVKLALEKATAHLWNEKEYPMPSKPEGSLEVLFHERLISISPKKRESAKAKIELILNDRTRNRTYGKLSVVDLRKNIEVSKQVSQINGVTDKPVDLINLNSLFTQSSTSLALKTSAFDVLDTLRLKIDAVQCVDETGSGNPFDPDGENTGDHIALGGNFVNEVGTTFSIGQIDLGRDFGDNQFREIRIDLFNCDLSNNPDVFPRYYFVNLTMAELDNGAFSNFVNDLFRKVQEEVAKKINELVKAGLISLGKLLGGDVGAKTGEFIAGAIAPIIAKVISDAFSWIKNVWEDDVYPPQTLSIYIPHKGALFMPNDGLMSPSRLSEELSLNFKRDDGEYNLFFSCDVDWSFSHANLVSIYGGSPVKNTQSKCFGAGKYDTWQLGIENDSMFLAKVPKPFILVLCEHWKWLGKKRVIHSEEAGLLPPSFESMVSSIIVLDNLEEVKQYGATLFEHANFEGKRRTFGSGMYNLADYGFDNKISSIKTQLPTYYRVEIFDEPNCQGKSLVIDNDIPYVGNEWNDKVSSIRVTSWRQLTKEITGPHQHINSGPVSVGTGTFTGNK